MGRTAIDLCGVRFGRLTVMGRDANRGAKTAWLALCDCGTKGSFLTGDLRSGRTKSCGCLHRERITKHDHTRFRGWVAREYRSWQGMKDRCTNPNAVAFHRYGGRGITVCERWRESFENFLADMGPRPTARHTLDRMDNDGPYSPENCRWATRGEQAKNRTWNPESAWDGTRDGAGRFKRKH